MARVEALLLRLRVLQHEGEQVRCVAPGAVREAWLLVGPSAPPVRGKLN